MEIKNRHVLVTGASRGIGRAFAKICAQDQAHLHIVLRQDDVELVKELEANGAKSVNVWIADLSTRHGVDQLISHMKDVPVDILFNNAGVLTGGLLEEQPLDDVYELIQVNIAALIHLTHSFLPGMLKRKRGKVINNSSVSAFMHFPCASTYAASKAAVVAFTDSLRLELKDTGVSTLLLVTPAIKTRMYDEIETLYGKNFDIPQFSIPPAKYAEIIREAVIHDLPVVEPSGLTGIGLKIAKYIPPLFNFEVSRRFRR